MRLALSRSRRPARPSRASWKGTAAGLKGPLFAAADAGQAYQGGFGFSGGSRDRSVSVSVCHVSASGELDVETSDERGVGGAEFDDWRLVSDWLHRAVRPHKVQFPLTITAERWTQDVLVDGQPFPFTFVGGTETWCASGRVEDRQVSVAGTRWPHCGLSLVSLPPKSVSADVPEGP